MSTVVFSSRPSRLEVDSIAATALQYAVKFWFGVTVAGQLAFAFAIVSFYGMTALRGDYHAWRFTHGFVPGVTNGNPAVVIHLITAAILMGAGTIQLVPQVRSRSPVFHRWNGRVYMLSALALSAAGLYIIWFRGSVGDLPQHVASALNVILIWLFAALTLRSALARDFRIHRRWALRMFMVVSGSFFIRIMLFLTFLIFKGPVGFDPATFAGPYLTFLGFAQYLLPLAVLELYFYTQDRRDAAVRIAMAFGLTGISLAMAAGLFAVTMAVWVPNVKAAFDPRRSVVEPLSATITSSGVDAALAQYRELKATQPNTYNFDEDQLNSLGYRLIGERKFNDAIRIFQLNVDVFPQSANVYDSLAEAYMDAGNKPQAIAGYKKSLELNPKNANGVAMLKKLGEAP
jgi:hypothetical protein